MLDKVIWRVVFEVGHEQADFTPSLFRSIDKVPDLFVIGASGYFGNPLKFFVNFLQGFVFCVLLGCLR